MRCTNRKRGYYTKRLFTTRRSSAQERIEAELNRVVYTQGKPDKSNPDSLLLGFIYIEISFSPFFPWITGFFRWICSRGF